MFWGFSYASVAAAENTSLIDNLIGTTFKMAAKAFVSASDIEKIKKNNITKLEKMNEEKFRKRYAKIYETINGCPSLALASGLKPDLTRQEAVDKIKSLNKERLYGLMDSVPNSFIASQFRLYLEGKKEKIKKNTLLVQIQQFWDNMARKAVSK